MLGWLNSNLEDRCRVKVRVGLVTPTPGVPEPALLLPVALVLAGLGVTSRQQRSA